MGGQLRPVDWDRKAMLASKEFGSSRITSIRIADPLLLLGFHSREDPESQQPREGGLLDLAVAAAAYKSSGAPATDTRADFDGDGDVYDRGLEALLLGL